MIQQKEITLRNYPRGYHLITSEIEGALEELPERGMVNIFIKHTSAGLTINENADPSVRTDFETIFNRLVPEGAPYYTHTMEGSDDMPAHVKASLVGMSVTVPIKNGRLEMGTWQGIYFCEFRNRAGRRKLVLTVYS
ncbi:MAG: secondary thiamine-phosphate synthase enzyme YjbQ [Bacteroidales bacterium]|nr:secondary thiamine-phosphate synthase enzyme YjbQ [Bacteroidales bacterium]